MIQTIYYIILIYFLLGGIGFYLINRKKAPEIARKSYTKFGVYFLIINILFFSIVVNPLVFWCLSLLIIGVGFFELFRLFQQSGYSNTRFFLLSLMVYGAGAAGLLFFGTLQKKLILFSFVILSIFDSFSQITGQLFGGKKLFPVISPGKTLSGFIGGSLIAVGSSFLLNGLLSGSRIKVLTLSLGIVLFAFAGDMAASYFKRKFGVKDYSNLIPGHGGFLDRFDSLIGAGAWVAFYFLVLNS